MPSIENVVNYERSKIIMNAAPTTVPEGYLGNAEMLQTQRNRDGTLVLTTENVEKVLDEVRPYLINDGGNVKLVSIDGPVVKVELEGACGSCISSTTTMTMGIERALKEQIPEIQVVE